jgi:hypothetical protein
MVLCAIRFFVQHGNGVQLMGGHYTRNAFECTAWCNRCRRDTQHRVDGGRRGPCLECIKKRELENEVNRIKRGIAQEDLVEHERKNPKLF